MSPHALTGRPGPVHLNIPVDLWERPLAEVWFDPKTYRPDTRTFDRVAVQRAAAYLMQARYPVLFVGSGVGSAGAQEHLRSLAELGAVVVLGISDAGAIQDDVHGHERFDRELFDDHPGWSGGYRFRTVRRWCVYLFGAHRVSGCDLRSDR